MENKQYVYAIQQWSDEDTVGEIYAIYEDLEDAIKEAANSNKEYGTGVNFNSKYLPVDEDGDVIDADNALEYFDPVYTHFYTIKVLPFYPKAK